MAEAVAPKYYTLLALARQIDWDVPAMGLAAAFAFPLLRLALDRLLFAPLGRALLLPHTKKRDAAGPTPAQRQLLAKWSESFWKLLVYASFVAVGLAAARHEPWFTDTRHFWIGCTRLPCDYAIPRGVKLLYVLEMGFYTQAIPSMLFWDVRRKDFYELLFHHFATLFLVLYSYLLNLSRAGTMVFLCHDINDIFLESAKMANYAGSAAATPLFVVFVLSWVASRLVYYPFWVVRSIWSEPIELVAKPFNINPQPHHAVFTGLLSFLLVLHVYWSYLIFRVAYRQVVSGKVSDVREEED